MLGRLIGSWLALAVLGAGAAAAAEPLGLHPEVVAAFERYAGALRPGAFAVSEDGASFGQSLCEASRCNPAAQRRAALAECRGAATVPCVLLASGGNVLLDYRALTRAEMSACPLSPVPTIRVSLTERDDRFERGRTLVQLSHLIFDDERHWIDGEGTAMGVTEHFFDIDRRGIGFVETEGRGDVRCIGYKDGTIELTLGATIYVAKEIPTDTCLYREVLAHEYKHRALGSEMTRQFARDLEATIAERLAEAPYAELAPGTMPWRLADDRLDAIIAESYDVFRRDHSRAQLAIDSNDEYRRVDLACPGETEKYTR